MIIYQKIDFASMLLMYLNLLAVLPVMYLPKDFNEVKVIDARSNVFIVRHVKLTCTPSPQPK